MGFGGWYDIANLLEAAVELQRYVSKQKAILMRLCENSAYWNYPMGYTQHFWRAMI
jgi:hypothetical protein